MTTDELALTIKVAESALDRFIQSRKGPTQLAEERKAKENQTKKAAIIKHGASSRVAGYLQARQGRRPMRVDTLLAKSEKHAKKSALNVEACLPKQGSVPLINPTREQLDELNRKSIGRPILSLYPGRKTEPHWSTYKEGPDGRPQRVSISEREAMALQQQLKQKQAAFVPPLVAQLALGTLYKLAGEEEYDTSVARAARKGRKIVGVAAGGAVGAATGGEIARQLAPSVGRAAPVVYVAAPVAGALAGSALGYGASQLEQAYWDRARRLDREKREAALAEARKAQEIV